MKRPFKRLGLIDRVKWPGESVARASATELHHQAVIADQHRVIPPVDPDLDHFVPGKRLGSQYSSPGNFLIVSTPQSAGTRDGMFWVPGCPQLGFSNMARRFVVNAQPGIDTRLAA